MINPDYFAYEALNGVSPPIWDGKRISMVPNFAWGNRITNAPTNVPYPGFGHAAGFWTSTAIIVSMAALLYVIFRRKGWL